MAKIRNHVEGTINPYKSMIQLQQLPTEGHFVSSITPPTAPTPFLCLPNK